MAKKRTPRRPAAPTPVPKPTVPAVSIPVRPSITADRFIRLHKLLTLLATGPKSRATLTRDLGLDVRGFYRDLELLRQAGIPVQIEDGHYTLAEDIATATARLPYPDPVLSLGEIVQIARGKSLAHTKLRAQIDDLLA